jgi:cytochrome P450
MIDRRDLQDPGLYRAGLELAAYAELRAESPVWWHPLHRGGFWAVLGHAAATEVLTRAEIFTSELGTRAGVRRPPGAARTMNNLDGPAHAALRAIVAPTFAALEPIDAPVERIATDAWRRIAAGHRIDVAAELAPPVAASALCAWLGLPADRAADLERLVRTSHRDGAAALDSVARRAPEPAAITAARAAKAAIGRWVDAGLSDARDGAYARLAAARSSGVLDAEAARHLGALLIEAGFPTLADAATGAVAIAAGQRPVDLDRPGSTDELIRLACPVAQFARTATRDAELGGRSIAAGDQVVVYFAAANRDPSVFADPDAARPDRRPNPHLSLGAGAPRCPGAGLARRLLHRVLAGLPDLRIAAAPVHRASRYLRGYDGLIVEKRRAGAGEPGAV